MKSELIASGEILLWEMWHLFFIFGGLSLNFSSKIKWQPLDITAIRVWCCQVEEHFEECLCACICVYPPVHVCVCVCAITVQNVLARITACTRISAVMILLCHSGRRAFFRLLISLSSKLCCCLYVTMETLVAIHQPISAEASRDVKKLSVV